MNAKTAAMVSTPGEVQATEPTPTAAEILAELEGKAAPLRDRLAEIDAELAALNARGGHLDIPDEIVARKKAAELDMERGVVADRLEAMEPRLAEARAEAKEVAAATLREEVAAAGLAALVSVQKKAEDLMAEIEKLRTQAVADARRGAQWRNSRAIQVEVQKVSGSISRAKNILNSLVQ